MHNTFRRFFRRPIARFRCWWRSIYWNDIGNEAEGAAYLIAAAALILLAIFW